MQVIADRWSFATPATLSAVEELMAAQQNDEVAAQ